MDNSGQKKDFKAHLDFIEKGVFAELKPIGFKKNLRTFNRRLEDGIIQVVNLQSGKHPIAHHPVCETSYAAFRICRTLGFLHQTGWKN